MMALAVVELKKLVSVPLALTTRPPLVQIDGKRELR